MSNYALPKWAAANASTPTSSQKPRATYWCPATKQVLFYQDSVTGSEVSTANSETTLRNSTERYLDLPFGTAHVIAGMGGGEKVNRNAMVDQHSDSQSEDTEMMEINDDGSENTVTEFAMVDQHSDSQSEDTEMLETSDDGSETTVRELALALPFRDFDNKINNPVRAVSQLQLQLHPEPVIQDAAQPLNLALRPRLHAVDRSSNSVIQDAGQLMNLALRPRLSAIDRSSNPPQGLNPLRGDLRQTEVAIRKREYEKIRPWDKTRRCFIGKAEDFMGRDTRVRLFVHETYQLLDIRKRDGDPLNRVHVLKDGEDKEWYSEAIQRAYAYFDERVTKVRKMETSDEKVEYYEALVENRKYLRKVQDMFDEM